MMRARLSFGAALSLLVLAACSAPAPPPKPEFHAVTESPAPLDTAPADMAVLNRVSWGTETADAQTLAHESLQSWLAYQLKPPADDAMPPDAASQIAAMEISQKSVIQIDQEIRALQQTAQKAK